MKVIEGPGRYKKMTLSVGEFMRRFLMHVLPKRFHRIRHYGLFANGARAENIQRARELLRMAAAESECTNADDPGEHSHRCPCCGGSMIIIETFERGTTPRYRSATPVLAKIDPTITPHIGRTPDLVAAADLGPDESRTLLDLENLREVAPARTSHAAMRGQRALDAFLLDPAAPAAARIVGALGNMAPNATTADDLARHLALPANDVDAGLDLLAAIGASDTMPRGDTRIARLSARLRLRVVDTPVVGLV